MQWILSARKTRDKIIDQIIDFSAQGAFRKIPGKRDKTITSLHSKL